jgi:hypothetical protein
MPDRRHRGDGVRRETGRHPRAGDRIERHQSARGQPHTEHVRAERGEPFDRPGIDALVMGRQHRHHSDGLAVGDQVGVGLAPFVDGRVHSRSDSDRRLPTTPRTPSWLSRIPATSRSPGLVMEER